MSQAETKPKSQPERSFAERRRLPRGIHALPAEAVQKDQRERILEALPQVVAEHGYEGFTVAHIVERAGIARGAFYKQFKNRRDCFEAAHEAAQERLLGVLTFPCYARAGLAERVEASLGAGLDLLASEPALARLLTVEAPAAGAEIARQHHGWLGRYGALLHLAAVDAPDAAAPAQSVERVIVGGIASRIAGEVLEGRAAQLRDLTPNLVSYVLAFYRQPEQEVSARSQSAAEAASPAPEPAVA